MKKIIITLNDLFNLPTASIYCPDGYKSAAHVTIDSRKVQPNSIFVAIKGEKFNGHDFVDEALAKGANAVVINEGELKKYENSEGTIVTVENTVYALGDLANVWRNKLSAKVIGITGSNGKTTTKEMLSVLLAERFKVQATVGNNNNHIGVPLTIFSCSSQHQILIAETGTNHFGEIAYSAKILQPNFALITNIGASHLEYLKDLQGVRKEKISLFDETKKNKGLVFINFDDSRLNSLTTKYRNISFGFDNGADVQASMKGCTKDGRIILRIHNKKTTIECVSSLLGEHNAKNLIAAIAVALKLGELIKKNMQDVKVVYTRSGDYFVELYKRGKIANEKNGKLFISIHCNAAPKKKRDPNGFEVYLLRPGRTEEAIGIAERENKVIEYEDDPTRYQKLTDENFILVSMAHSASMKYSEKFADMVHRQFKQNLALTPRGVKQAGFYVLVGASMPSVLIETGYVSNPQDASFIKSEKGQLQLARSIVSAIKSFKSYYDKVIDSE